MNAELLSLSYRIPTCDTHLRNFPLVIGSAKDAEIRLDDHSVSKYHCQIDLLDGELFLRDLESVHGTFVNSEPVADCVLHHGDELAVGSQTFLVQISQDERRNFSLPPKGMHWQRSTREPVGAASV